MYHDHVISFKEHFEWYHRCSNSKNEIHLLFCYKNKPLGVVNFKDINLNDGTTKWGFYLGEDERPKNAGIALGYLGLSYAFEKLGLQKVYGECFSFNIRSIHFHEKLGFKKEGKLIKGFFREGSYHDIIIFSIFKENWEEDNKFNVQKLIYETNK